MLIQGADSSSIVGTYWKLEDAATIILLRDRRAIDNKVRENFTDWYTDEQWEARYRREVYPVSGMADAHFLRGQYSRAWSSRPPRPTNRRRYARWLDIWRQDCFDSWGFIPSEW